MKNKENMAQIGLTRDEAATYLGISKPSLDRIVKRGLLTPCRVLRRPLFTKDQLDALLNETNQMKGIKS